MSAAAPTPPSASRQQCNGPLLNPARRDPVRLDIDRQGQPLPRPTPFPFIRRCEVTHWKPRADSGSGALTFAVPDLLCLMRPATRLVVVNFPNNPTGAALTRGEWAQLVGAVQNHESGCYLFSDEMYRWLVHDEACECPSAADAPFAPAAAASSPAASPVRRSAGALPSPGNRPGAPPPSPSMARAVESPGTIALCGLSKSFGAPGLRVGWLVSKDKDLLVRKAADPMPPGRWRGMVCDAF